MGKVTEEGGGQARRKRDKREKKLREIQTNERKNPEI